MDKQNIDFGKEIFFNTCGLSHEFLLTDNKFDINIVKYFIDEYMPNSFNYNITKKK